MTSVGIKRFKQIRMFCGKINCLGVDFPLASISLDAIFKYGKQQGMARRGPGQICETAVGRIEMYETPCLAYLRV